MKTRVLAAAGLSVMVFGIVSPGFADVVTNGAAVQTSAVPASTALSSASSEPEGPLVLARRIPMPGVRGGLNHISASAKTGYVFVPATKNGTIEVVDAKVGKVVQSLVGDRPYASRYCAAYNELYVTFGHLLAVFDATSLRELTSLDLTNGLNEIHHDPGARLLYVGSLNQDNPGIEVVDIPTHQLVGKIDLPARPFGFALGGEEHRLFANLPTLGKVAVVDRENRALLQLWPLKDAADNYPLALDEADHRLFIGCRKPQEMVVLDTTNGSTVAAVAIGRDADDIFYDPTHELICVTCGGGQLDVIKKTDANTYSLAQTIRTGDRARTSYLSTSQNELFVAVPEMDGHGAELQVYTATGSTALR
jgi:DNA-binding beta-propeller fold protein YncE